MNETTAILIAGTLKQQEVGEVRETISGRTDAGEISIALNPRFTHDLAMTFDEDIVVLELRDEFKPVVARSNDVTSLLMPMRAA